MVKVWRKTKHQAVQWYRKAAEQGAPLGQANLGVMLADGRGVSQNSEQAYFWLLLASVHDSRFGKFRDLVEKDLTSAQISKVQASAAIWKPNKGY